MSSTSIEHRFLDPKPVYEGKFGCTIRVKDVEKGNARRAIKIQYVSEEKEVYIRAEVQLSKQLATVIERRLAPSVIQTYEILKRKSLPQSWMQLIKNHAPNTNNTICSGKGYFLLIVMELATKGSLKTYLNHCVFSHTIRLSKKMLAQLLFQLVWTLNVLQRIYGLRHFDLKPDNIVVTYNNLHEYAFILKASPTTGNIQDIQWHLQAGTPQLKLIDFGLSKISKTCSSGATQVRPEGAVIKDLAGTIHYMDPATFFVEIYRRQNMNAVIRNLDVDMWSLGLIAIDMALTGWRKPCDLHHEGWPEDECWSPKRFKNVLLFHKNYSTRHELFLEKEITQLICSKSCIPKNGVAVVIGMCLLNEQLGNGLLPNPQKWPEVAESKLLEVLTAHKNEIFDNVSCYAWVKYELKKRMGDRGLDFLKRMLSWSPNERARFGYSEAVSANYLLLTICHPYFSDLRCVDSASPAKTVWTYDENSLKAPVRIILPPKLSKKLSSPISTACFLCGNAATMQCSRCKVYSYCSKSCQQHHWEENHRSTCGL